MDLEDLLAGYMRRELLKRGSPVVTGETRGEALQSLLDQVPEGHQPEVLSWGRDVGAEVLPPYEAQLEQPEVPKVIDLAKRRRPHL